MRSPWVCQDEIPMPPALVLCDDCAGWVDIDTTVAHPTGRRGVYDVVCGCCDERRSVEAADAIAAKVEQLRSAA